MANDLIQVLDASSFNDAIKSPTLTLVDFWAPWCRPCQLVAPTLDALATEYEGRVQVAKVNVDDNQELAADLGVSGIPAFVLFHNGTEVNRLVGALPKTAFTKFLEHHLNALAPAAETVEQPA